jgi:hypothetical protein
MDGYLWWSRYSFVVGRMSDNLIGCPSISAQAIAYNYLCKDESTYNVRYVLASDCEAAVRDAYYRGYYKGANDG